MADDLQEQIRTSRLAGYSDDEITDYLSSRGDLADQLKAARDQGYNSQEILDHLSPKYPSGKPETGIVPSLMGGITSGAFTTAENLYKAGRFGFKAATLGLGELPQVPEFLQKAAAPKQYDPYGRGYEPNVPFKMGRMGEQAGEFFLPSKWLTEGTKALDLVVLSKFLPEEVVAQGPKAIETFVSKLPWSGRALVGLEGAATRMGGEATSAGLVTLAQTGGDVLAAEKAAITAASMSGVFSTVGTLLKAVPLNRLYMSALIKKFPERFRGEGGQAEAAVGKMVENNILLTAGGKKAAEELEKAGAAARDKLIEPYLNELVDPEIVAGPLRELRRQAASRGEKGIVAQIDKRLADYMEAKGAAPAVPAREVTSPVLGPTGQPITTTIPGVPATPAKITVQKAIEDKDFFQMLAKKFYGKFSEGKGEIRKLLGGGINDALEEISPAYREANRRDVQTSLLLKNAIEKYIEDNPSLMNPKVAVLMLFHGAPALAYGAMMSPRLRLVLAGLVPTLGAGVQTTGTAATRIVAGRVSQSAQQQLPPVPQQLPPIPERPR